MNPQRQTSEDEPDFVPDELEEAVNATSVGTGVPEVNEETKALTEWDRPTDAAGHETPAAS